MIKYILSNDPSDCCGCRACELACAHHALSMKTDDEGFPYPALDASKCIDCGLCGMVCPMMNPKESQNETGKALVAQNMDSEDLNTSSSGGVFIAIAKYVLSKEGVVYGAAYQDGPMVAHERVDNPTLLEKLKGSKYVQSDTRDIFNQVKADLRAKRLVYFVGTPCQVAGLKLFLRKNYDNLITSDLICHGIPSPKIFQNTVSHIERKLDADFVDYSFRDKKVRGWNCSSSSSYTLRVTGKQKYINYSKDMEAYYKAFIAGHIMRMNCYHCPFATTQRCGDITLADFWGVRKYMPDFPSVYRGVSLLLVNTKKGQKIMDCIKSTMLLRPLDMQIAIDTNPNLKHSTPFSEEREVSYHLAFNDYPAFLRKYYHGRYWMKNLRVQAEYTIRKYNWLFALVSNVKKILK